MLEGDGVGLLRINLLANMVFTHFFAVATVHGEGEVCGEMVNP